MSGRCRELVRQVHVGAGEILWEIQLVSYLQVGGHLGEGGPGADAVLVVHLWMEKRGARQKSE